mmetsp:Transcript_22572/g.73370  ORF Transcript_22572/g.73370 Transcript_22572/m.73370 type:complete len:166 (+) Transcript_22572:627-1124(+)
MYVPPRPFSSRTSEQTLSKNARSWVTSRSAVSCSAWSASSKYSTPAALKWFVGSSSKSTSGFCSIAAASATRLRCPPERTPHSRSMNGLQPSRSSIARTFSSVVHASKRSISSRAFSNRRCPFSPPASFNAALYSRTHRITGRSDARMASTTAKSGASTGSCSRK